MRGRAVFRVVFALDHLEHSGEQSWIAYGEKVLEYTGKSEARIEDADERRTYLYYFYVSITV